jgi:hypothetical protein
MKTYISHPPTRDNADTRFAADYAAGVSSISVKNTSGFAVDNFIVLGKVGFEQAEIIKISTITDNTTLALASNTKFPHSRDTLITLIDYDKIRVYKSSDGISGTYSLETTIEIAIDQDVTSFEDTSALETDYYKFAAYNSVTAVEGGRTDAVASTGFTFYSLATMINRVLSLFGDSNAEFVTRDEVKDYINEKYEVAQHEAALATNRFNISTYTFTVTVAIDDYALPSDFLMEKAVRVSTDGGVKYPYTATMKSLDSLGSVVQNDVRYGYTVYGSYIKLDDPIPTNSSDIVKIYYIPTPDSLSDQTDVLQAPFVNASHIFVKYGLAMCYLKDKKVDDYKTLKDDADRLLGQHISFLKRLSNLHPQFVELMGVRTR